MRLDQSPVRTIILLFSFDVYDLLAGPIKTAALDFAGYIIPDQAFSKFILYSYLHKSLLSDSASNTRL